MKTIRKFVSLVLICLLLFSISTVVFAKSSSTTLIASVPAIIVFDANGGRGTMDAVSVDVGTEYTLPRCRFTAPRGRTFRCWQIGSETFDPGDAITVTSDITVRALWKTTGTSGGSSVINSIRQVLQTVIQIIRNIFSRWF